jgi:putative membrane protein
MKSKNITRSACRLTTAVTAIFSLLGASALFAQQPAPKYPPNEPVAPRTDEPRPRDPMQDRSAEGSKLSWKEAHFIRKSAEAGDEVIRISQIATQRATRPDVKTFAEQVIQHRRTENAELIALASQNGVVLSSPTEADLEAKWSKKNAKKFDGDYVDQMIDDYDSEARAYEKHTKSDDPQLAAKASQGLARLQEKLRQAKDLKKSIKASS